MAIPSRRLGQLTVSREYSPATRRFELPAQEFIHRQGISGVLLLIAAVLALLWANSPWAATYFHLWDARISFDFGFIHLGKSLHHWINDGLMTLFFLLVGMEIKGELIHGYLSSWRRAALPVFGALGGMIAPALLYVSLNHGTSTVAGWGIPMATDIAFAVGVMALIPGLKHELKVFLLALAIVDDIGAILIIALFYTESIRFVALLAAVGFLLAIQALKVAKVNFGFPYVLFGVLFWIAISSSGVHATIAGVILAFCVTSHPAIAVESFESRAVAMLDEFHTAMKQGDKGRAETSLGSLEALTRSTDPAIERLTRGLHPWVGFVVLPLFAFANSGVTLSSGEIKAAVDSPVLWGVVVGLFVGKPLGIVLFAWIANRIRLAEMPPGISMRHLFGAGTLAGIGFTVAIFIATLAFSDEATANIAKIGILASSLIAGLAGFLMLKLVTAEHVA